MKLKTVAILFISLACMGALSCSNSTGRSRKPVAKITISTTHKDIYAGDTITIHISVKTKDGDLKTSEIYLDNELVQKSGETEFDVLLNNYQQLGKHQIKAVSTKTDGAEGVNFRSFTVLSDITPELMSYEVVKSYPHNITHFTQGLEIHDGYLYEGTGENGKSAIFKIELPSGKILKSAKLEDKYFGEGITVLNNKIYQLTYKAQKGFVFDLNTFARIDSFSYQTPQGWGLTNDGKYLIKTDSSEMMHFIDPSTMEVVRKVPVYDNQGPVQNLNELEYYDGDIYANVWTTNTIVKIDAKTGKVLAKINFEGLLPVTYDPQKPVDVFNGIAIDKASGKVYVTGKLWPKLFEVKLIRKG